MRWPRSWWPAYDLTLRPFRDTDLDNMAVTLFTNFARCKGSLGALDRLLQTCYDSASEVGDAPGDPPNPRTVARARGVLYSAIYGSFVRRVGDEEDPSVVSEIVRVYKPWLLKPELLALARAGAHTNILTPNGRCIFPANFFDERCEPAAKLLIEIDGPSGPSGRKSRRDFVRENFPPVDGRGLALAAKVAPLNEINDLFATHGTVETLRRVPVARYADLAAWITSPWWVGGRIAYNGTSVYAIARQLRSFDSVTADDAGRIVAFHAALKSARPSLQKTQSVAEFIATDEDPRRFRFLLAVEPFRPSLRQIFGPSKFQEVQREAFLELFREYYERAVVIRQALLPLGGTGLGETITEEFVGQDMRWETLNVLARFALRRGNADAFPAQDYAKRFAATLRSTKAAFRLSEFRANNKRPRARGDGRRSARRRLNSSSR